jgi:hypothetical protein
LPCTPEGYYTALRPLTGAAKYAWGAHEATPVRTLTQRSIESGLRLGVALSVASPTGRVEVARRGAPYVLSGKHCRKQGQSPKSLLLGPRKVVTEIPAAPRSFNPKMPKKAAVAVANYEPEKVVGSRGSGKNIEYEVKWVGFKSAENTWEPAANLASCKEVPHFPSVLAHGRHTDGMCS